MTQAADSNDPFSSSRRLPAESSAVFAHRGDYWHIVFAGEVCHLRDSKGLRYIAHLLRRPGEKVPSLELVETAGRGDGKRAVSPGVRTATERRASSLESSYRDRLRQVRADLEAAHAKGDSDGTAVLAEEIDFLVERSARIEREALDRSPERARLTVTKCVGSALRKIGSAHPSLGAHLAATIRRGYSCSYTPDPRSPLVWGG